MVAVVGGAILVLILLAVVAAFAWQGGKRFRGNEAVVYAIEDATRFVHTHLDPLTATRVTPARVRRILEWQIEYQQVVAPRSGVHPVVGSGDAIEHILEQAAARGIDLDPIDVAEVIAADVEFLMSIRAIGAPVEETA